MDKSEMFLKLSERMFLVLSKYLEKMSSSNPTNLRGGVLVYASEDLMSWMETNVAMGEINSMVCLANARRYIEEQLYPNSTNLVPYVSSFQNRDGIRFFGGAIWLQGTGFYSFSGLSEFADEACLLVSLQISGIMNDPEFVDHLIQISGNDVYPELVGYFI